MPKTATFAAFSLMAIAVSIPLLGAGPSGQRQTFRSGVDLIAVDVRVLDRSGHPVAGFTPASFRVTIDGQLRKVVSAAFARYDITALPARASTSVATVSTAVTPNPLSLLSPPPAPAARTFIIAIDALSFAALDSHVATKAAQMFVDQLLPNDLVGMVALPDGAVVDWTTNHEVVREALGKVLGRRQNYLTQGGCELSVEDVIDTTSALERMPRYRVQPSGTCALSRDEVIELATFAGFHLEEDLRQQLDGLGRLFHILQTWPGTKTVLLVSGGMPMTDRLSGRPNVGDAITKLGQQAAYANATVHALYFDNNFVDGFSAAHQGLNLPTARTKGIFTNAMAQLAEPSGGTLLDVDAGTGEREIDRLLRETSSYYVLGVEPDERDRDGRPHRINVKVAQSGVEVRSRQVVIVPKPARK